MHRAPFRALLLRLRQLHPQPAVPRPHRRELAVPAVDQRPLVLDLAKFQQLRRQRGLPDLVRLRLAVRASYRRLGLAFRLGDGLRRLRLRLGLRLGQFVPRASASWTVQNDGLAQQETVANPN